MRFEVTITFSGQVVQTDLYLDRQDITRYGLTGYLNDPRKLLRVSDDEWECALDGCYIREHLPEMWSRIEVERQRQHQSYGCKK